MAARKIAITIRSEWEHKIESLKKENFQMKHKHKCSDTLLRKDLMQRK